MEAAKPSYKEDIYLVMGPSRNWRSMDDEVER
jgi:hypothetical protein